MINDAPLVSPDDEVLDGGEAAHDAARPHVMFLKKQDFDGSGRLFPGETASDSPVDSHLAHGNLLENSTMMDSPTTSSLHLPADQSQDRTAPEPIDGRRSPTNENGDSLPMTAQTPEEIERSLSHPEKPETNGETEKPGGSDRLAPSPMRKDSVVPEGVGSKRLYKLSKRFSTATCVYYVTRR